MSATVINLADRGRRAEVDTTADHVDLPRMRRLKQFNKARLYLRFWEQLRDTQSHAQCLSDHHGVDVGFDVRPFAFDDWALLDKIREAQAALLLTPVSNAEQLNQKRRMIKGGLRYVPVDATKLADALAADEAFLALPHRQRRAAIGGA